MTYPTAQDARAHLARLPAGVVACFQSVEREHGVVARELLSDDRCFRVAHARQALYAAIRAISWPNGQPRYSLPTIARFCGRLHHTTIIHGLRAHSGRMARAA